MSPKKSRPVAVRKPTTQEILKPVELLGIAFVLALFVGLIALIATRQPVLAAIGFGVAFIVSLVVLAMFTLSFRQGDDEKRDLDEQDRDAARRRDDSGQSPH
jgi:membrane protein implicated in regulation of membrane protease activity